MLDQSPHEGQRVSAALLAGYKQSVHESFGMKQISQETAEPSSVIMKMSKRRAQEIADKILFLIQKLTAMASPCLDP
jgi:hypothetical protein